MDFSFNEEQRAIFEAAGRVFGNLCSDDQIKALGADPCEMHQALWRQLAESGMLGLTLSEEVGGLALGLLELSGVLEAQGRHVAPVPLLSCVVEAAMTLDAGSNEELKQNILPAVAAGEHIIGLVRPYSGLRSTVPLTVSAQSDGNYRLQGRGGLTLYAPFADSFLLQANDEQGNPLMLSIPADTSGVEVTAQTAVSGEPAGYATFDNVLAGARDVVATGTEAKQLQEQQNQRAQIALAAIQTGVLDEGLKRAASYVSERKQFGRPLGAFQAVSQRAADAYMAVEVLRGALWRALDYYEQGEELATPAAVAKYWVAKSGHEAAHSFLHLHGGIGQDLDYPIHRYFLWAKFCERYLGSADELSVDIGEHVIASALAGA